MDEPTNDLDVETLELLEELLADYPGTLLLVSHDRDFLDNVVTSTLVREGDGRVGEYVGGYSDWLRQRGTERPPVAARPQPAERSAAPASGPGASAATRPPASVPPATDGAPNGARRKLSFKEARELEALPERIEVLETRLAEMAATMSDPDFFRAVTAAIAAHNAEMAAAQAELDAAYARWEALDAASG